MPDNRPIEHPPFNFPVAFADGLSSAAWSRSVVKFYLARNDPELRAHGEPVENHFLQVVMPLDGFVAATLFLNKVLEQLVNAGYVSQTDVDAAKARGDEL